MLTDPPCVDELFGCASTSVGEDSGTTGGSSASASSSSRRSLFFGSAADSESSSSSRSSSSFSSRSSSSRSAVDLSQYFGSGSSFLRSKKEYTARYSLKTQNISTVALQGVKVVHGPLPYHLTFDPARSSTECYQNQKNVECMVDIGPNQTKDLAVIYKAMSSFSCTSARFLQTAKATTATTTDSTPAIVSVSCAAETLDSQSSSSSSLSSSASSLSSFAPSYVVNSGTGFMTSSAPTYTTFGSGSLITQTPAVTDYKGEGSKGGYKPYAYTYVMPKTGVGDYFTSTSDFILLPMSKGVTDAPVSIPLLILSALVTAVLFKIVQLTLAR